MSDLGPGYVHVYTGDGKGKTTASLGLAVRAAGNGLRVLVLQFLKGHEMTGERVAARSLEPGLQIRPMGRDGLLRPGDVIGEDAELATAALAQTRDEISSGSWDLIVLDEINSACALGLVPVEAVLELMDTKPEGLELVMTGRGAPAEVIEKADLVTEMREVKHYFQQGVNARRGIEK